MANPWAVVFGDRSIIVIMVQLGSHGQLDLIGSSRLGSMLALFCSYLSLCRARYDFGIIRSDFSHQYRVDTRLDFQLQATIDVSAGEIMTA